MIPQDQNPYEAGTAAPEIDRKSLPKLSTWYLLRGFLLVPPAFWSTMTPALLVAMYLIPILRVSMLDEGLWSFLHESVMGSLVWSSFIIVLGIPFALFGNGRDWFHLRGICILGVLFGILFAGSFAGLGIYFSDGSNLKMSFYAPPFALIICLILLPSFTVTFTYAWWIHRGQQQALAKQSD